MVGEARRGLFGSFNWSFFERGCARVQHNPARTTFLQLAISHKSANLLRRWPKISLPHCANTNLYYSAAISHYAESFKKFYHRAQFFPRKSYLTHSAYLFPHHTSYFARDSSHFTLHVSHVSNFTCNISNFKVYCSHFTILKSKLTCRPASKGLTGSPENPGMPLSPASPILPISPGGPIAPSVPLFPTSPWK